VVFGFGLEVNDFLVVIGGHLGVKGVGEGKWVHKKRLISDIYHYDQREKRNPMGEIKNNGVEKGRGSTKKGLRSDRYHDDQGEEMNPM
jgi:hypothetical protein